MEFDISGISGAIGSAVVALVSTALVSLVGQDRHKTIAKELATLKAAVDAGVSNDLVSVRATELLTEYSGGTGRPTFRLLWRWPISLYLLVVAYIVMSLHDYVEHMANALLRATQFYVVGVLIWSVWFYWIDLCQYTFSVSWTVQLPRFWLPRVWKKGLTRTKTLDLLTRNKE